MNSSIVTKSKFLNKRYDPNDNGLLKASVLFSEIALFLYSTVVFL